MSETMSQFASVKDYYEAKIARLEKELSDALTGLELARREIRDNATLAARQIIPLDAAVEDLRAENVQLLLLVEKMKCCENCANVPADGIPDDWKKCLECRRYDSEKAEDLWTAKEAESEENLEEGSKNG
jgi:hypothetical protein